MTINKIYKFHYVLTLMAYTHDKFIQEEIKQVFKNTLLKYGIDSLLVSKSDKCPQTLIDFFKEDILWQNRQRRNQHLVNEVRELIYAYTQNKLFDSIYGKVNHFPLEKTQILLMIHLPYYEKVLNLLSLGVEFDRFFFNDCAYYNNIIDYTFKIGVTKIHGEFYNKKFSYLYKLLTLLIENAMPLKFDDAEVLQSVKKFENKKILKQIKQYLYNRRIVHYLKINEIEENLLHKGISKIIFKAKVSKFAKRISKNGNDFYFLDFIDDEKGNINIFLFPEDKQLVKFVQDSYLKQSWVNVEINLLSSQEGYMRTKIVNVTDY